MIELYNLTKSYAAGVKAVDDLSMTVQNGEIFGFLGPNGAGKTTTIKMITGITRPDSGTVLIDKIDIQREPLRAKRQFGYVPDSPDMFLRLKGLEYLNFIGDVYGVPADVRKTRIRELGERFEIYDKLGDQMQTYSHGMRQKAVLIGVLLHEPSNWILDEPMTGLDPKSAFILKQMMREHAQKGYSVIFSTHVLEVAEKLCDRVGIINKGKLVMSGTYDEIKEKSNDASLEEFFLSITEGGEPAHE
ncbi:ABC transporter ATP-binding protein [Feifania hominis]|uniref:ABC transporter ATP-binding protein n=1 Tax=Feifania hominis TaxID=2763660 RepID=A0A926HQX0_9FIRM|nr:ABC transporter ATP-binding protein [Feifania hominis]MBC8536807.1 ABC transporter ATP-binding protein [Feifania hominis]